MVAAPVVSGASADTQTGTVDACAHFKDQKVRVCSAYLVNSSFGALMPYYELGRSPNPSQVQTVTYRFRKRYVGAARQLIQRRVAAFPKGRYAVSARISIRGINVNSEGNRAALTTVETWKVTDSYGHSVFRLNGARLHIVMVTVQGLLGFNHRWVVSAIR
jgi:hypothetical protein